MNMRKLIMSVIIMAMLSVGVNAAEKAFTIGIMQSKKGEAKKYAPLIAYMKTKGITVSLVGMKNYSDAAKKFSAGKVDAMFSGSGVAGSLIIKDVAVPLVRPVSTADWSTYWAVVVAPKGAAKFTGDASYFDGKKVLCCSLASSGEFFGRSVYAGKDIKAKLLKAKSHGAALKALGKGVADLAIVKNRVYDSMAKDPKNKALFAKIEIVGKHNGQNPNGTLMLAKSVDAKMTAAIQDALIALEADKSAEAVAVKTALKVKKYIVTTKEDFKDTLPMLKAAGVTKDFDFKF